MLIGLLPSLPLSRRLVLIKKLFLVFITTLSFLYFVVIVDCRSETRRLRTRNKNHTTPSDYWTTLLYDRTVSTFPSRGGVENPSRVMKDRQTAPGDGIRSLKTSRVFRIINFELYSKPNKVIMALGLVSISFTFGYLVYMRHQYEKMGYYPAVAEDGRHEVYKQRQSKWD